VGIFGRSHLLLNDFSSTTRIACRRWVIGWRAAAVSGSAPAVDPRLQ